MERSGCGWARFLLPHSATLGYHPDTQGRSSTPCLMTRGTRRRCPFTAQSLHLGVDSYIYDQRWFAFANIMFAITILLKWLDGLPLTLMGNLY